MKLETKILELEKRLSEKEELLEEFLDRLSKSFERIIELEKVVKDQASIIGSFQGQKGIFKNSQNSNFPPSKDKFRLNRRISNREKSDKKSGGQKGHKGNTLEFRATPDEIIDRYPIHCLNCGSFLKEDFAVLHGSRQVIDLPIIAPLVYQYNTYKVKCNCGCTNQSVFPVDVNSSVQYGPRIRSVINYLSIRQYLPFERLSELLKDVMNVKLSEGTIANTIKRTAVKGKQIYDSIHDKVEQSKAVGGDETGLFVNAKKKTLWVWQTKLYTYLKITDSRHAKHIKETFENGFINGILNSDQYKAQLNTPAKGHQICWPHIFRRIKGLQEIQDSIWLRRLRSVIDQAYQLYYEKGFFKRKSKRTKDIEEQLNRLLLQKLHHKTHPEIGKLQASLRRDRSCLLTFLYHEEVPPDNNASETAIRNAKVKMKISGGFKSLHQQYAIIRSIIDTAIKNNCNVLDTLDDLEMGRSLAF